MAGGAGAPRAYRVMVKPMGAICNLDCTYGYYLHQKDLLASNSEFRISAPIARGEPPRGA